MELVSQTLSHSFSVEARPFRRAKLAGSENGALPMVRQKRGYEAGCSIDSCQGCFGVLRNFIRELQASRQMHVFRVRIAQFLLSGSDLCSQSRQADISSADSTGHVMC